MRNVLGKCIIYLQAMKVCLPWRAPNFISNVTWPMSSSFLLLANEVLCLYRDAVFFTTQFSNHTLIITDFLFVSQNVDVFFL